MKTILLTGATGFLGSYLLEKLVNTNQYNLITLSRNKEVLLSKYSNFDISHFDMEEFHENLVPFEKVDIVVHLAFARNLNFQDITDSIEFSKNIFTRINCPIVNISSRSVYGQNPETPWKEMTRVQPDSIYAIGKYCNELLLNCRFDSLKNKNYTNLRLVGLLGNELTDRIVNKFIQTVIKGDKITIKGGKQQFAFLDVRDAADGIIALLKVPPKRWKPVYNLGYTKSYNIVEIAESVARVAKEFNCPEVKIDLNKTDDTLYAELDSSLFYNDTNWKPQYTMEDVVRRIFEYQISKKMTT